VTAPAILTGLPVEYHSACGIALPAFSLSLGALFQRSLTKVYSTIVQFTNGFRKLYNSRYMTFQFETFPPAEVSGRTDRSLEQ
jgi:hypothetical protein